MNLLDSTPWNSLKSIALDYIKLQVFWTNLHCSRLSRHAPLTPHFNTINTDLHHHQLPRHIAWLLSRLDIKIPTWIGFTISSNIISQQNHTINFDTHKIISQRKNRKWHDFNYASPLAFVHEIVSKVFIILHHITSFLDKLEKLFPLQIFWATWETAPHYKTNPFWFRVVTALSLLCVPSSFTWSIYITKVHDFLHK